MKTFKYKNPKTGAVEIYDEDTGDLISVEKESSFTSTLKERCVEVDLPSGQKALVHPSVQTSTQWEYSKELCQKICDELVMGGKLHDICDGVKFPPPTVVLRWRRSQPEFTDMLKNAYEDRAEFLSDKLRTLADQTNEGNYSSKTVQINAYKHLASVDNPNRFQPKPVAAAPQLNGGAQTIVIVTGVPAGTEEKVAEKIIDQIEKKDGG